MKKDFIIPLLGLLCVIALLMYSPIPQNQNYHNFADNRTFIRIPNFLNVVTNLPFGVIGIWGLMVARNVIVKRLRQMWIVIFIGFILLMFGSGYYHLYPNNETLVYDRIPITIIIMSFFAFIIYDSIGRTTGYRCFIFFNIVGIASVAYWLITEHEGVGDLRWYGIVQFFPVIAIPLITLL